MRKIGTWILALVMALGMGCAAAQEAQEVQKAPDYIMEGYDDSSASHIWETNKFFARMEERTGISFEFRQVREEKAWDERKKEIREGTNLPDVLFKAALTPEETQAMKDSGVIIDLKPYLEQYAPDLWALLQEKPEYLAAITLPDGSIPALPGINRLQNNDAMWINQSWLKRMEIATPTTAEELTEVLRAMKTRDPNGNGKQDEIPLAFIGMWELRFLGHAFGMIDNDYYVRAKDGKVTSSLTTEENRQFLTWLHGLWEENLLDHNGFSTSDSLRQITDDKTDNPYGLILSSTVLTVVPSSMMKQYALLEPLTWQGEQIYRDLAGDVIRGTFAITSKCKDPEKLVAWVNLLYIEEYGKMAEYGLEDEEYSFEGDGLWNWNSDMTTVAQQIMPENTITGGGEAPGIIPVDFQLQYGDELTRTSIEQIARLKELSVVPYPIVYLSAEDAARIQILHTEIALYAEKTMACFVTGDLEMNDENWATFCKTVLEKGLDEEIGIWQKYVE